MLIKSLMAAFGGALGGVVFSRTMHTGKLWKKISAVATSGFTGHYVGYVVALWAIHEYEFLLEGDFMVAGAAGFVSGAVVPILYNTFLAIANAIKDEPKTWFELITKAFSNATRSPEAHREYSKSRSTISYEPPEN